MVRLYEKYFTWNSRGAVMETLMTGSRMIGLAVKMA